MWLVDARFESPSVPSGTYGVKEMRVWPTETRQRGSSYKGRFMVRVAYSIDGKIQPILEKSLGNLPVMLGSDACNLKGYTPAQLIEHGEQVCAVAKSKC
jgi:DNA-directed RNA polymerase I subunit RPA2